MLSDLVICTTANCTSTWLYNSNRILKHEITRTPDDTRWWRLVRLVHADLGLPLRAAAKIADATLRPGLTPTRVRLNATPDGALAIQLDLERFLTTTSATLGAALNFSVPARRGRPPKTARQAPNATTPIPEGGQTPTVRLSAFQAHDADVRVLLSSKQGVLTAIYDPAPRNLERMAAALTAMGARHRGVPIEWPQSIDAVTVRTVARMALLTGDGPLDLVPARTPS